MSRCSVAQTSLADKHLGALSNVLTRSSKDSSVRAIAVFAVVPVMAVVAWATPSQSPHVAYPAMNPLTFAQQAIVHGEVASKPVVEATFRFTNTGLAPTNIVELLPSCGCLKPRLTGGKVDGNATRFEPGETGEFTIGVETANEPPGPQVYSVLVRTQSDGIEQTQVVRYALTLPKKKLTVQPNAVYFLQVQGEASEKRLEIFDPRPSKATITELNCDHPLISLRSEPTKNDGITNVVVSLAEGVRPGRKMTSIEIRTDDPEYPIIRVPMVIQGPKTTAF